MQRTLVSSATGSSPNPTINTSYTFKRRLDAWTSDAAKNKTCADAAETASDILGLGGLEDVQAWEEAAFHATLVDHILAAEMVLDDLAGTSAGKLKAFGQILGSVRELYKNHILWPEDLIPYETVITAVIDYLLQRCGETRKQCSDRELPDSICYVDLQRDLERAFVLNIPPDSLSEHVEHLPLVFRWLYQDCCDSLWHEELEERERMTEEAVQDGDECYDEIKYDWDVDASVRDCGCGRSMIWHMTALSDEAKWTQTERQVWSKRFPKRRPPRYENQSPLGLFEESCDYDRPEEDCQENVIASLGEGHT